MLKTGQKAPHFRGPDQHGVEVDLDRLREKGPVVLYFYPKDFTRGCTQQACQLRDSHAELDSLGATVVGVSVDDPETHRRFAAEHGLRHSLLSDENREIARAYGALQPLGLFAKRVTFVLDRSGTIRGVFHHELRIGRHVDQVRRLLEQLQAESPGASSSETPAEQSESAS